MVRVILVESSFQFSSYKNSKHASWKYQNVWLNKEVFPWCLRDIKGVTEASWLSVLGCFIRDDGNSRGDQAFITGRALLHIYVQTIQGSLPEH